MKRSKLFVTLLAAGMLSLSTAMAQTQVIKLTTAKEAGQAVTFSVNNVKGGVTVDWGDGQTVSYPAATGTSLLELTGTVKGSIITLTADKRLNTLICPGQALTSILLEEAPNMVSLYCQNNRLTQLDLTPCAKLTDLNCSNNQISRLLLTEKTHPVIQNVSMANNGMTSNQSLTQNSPFTIRHANLQHLDISGNAFTGVSFSMNRNLDVLECANCGLTSSLQVQTNTELSALNCSNNDYTTIKASTAGLPKLRQIIADNNKLTSLDLSASAELTHVYVTNNELTNISFAEGLIPYAYACDNNNLNFSSLPGRTTFSKIKYFSYAGQKGILDITSKLQKQEDWSYITLCPSWDDKLNAQYILDLSEYAKDPDGSTITLTPYGRNDVAEDFVKMTKQTANKKENDYYVGTGTNAGKFSFHNPFKEAYIQLTHSKYPDLVIKTTLFSTVDPSTGINDITLNNAGILVKPGKGELHIQCDKGQMVRIYNAAGQEVMHRHINGSETIKLPSGVYIVGKQKVAI